MSKETNLDVWHDKIRDAVFEQGASREFRDLLFNNPKFSRNKHVHSETISRLVEQVSASNDDEMVEVLLELLEPEAKNNLQKQLIVALLRDNIVEVESLLKNGVKIITNREWKEVGTDLCLPAVYSILIYRRANEIRKKMLSLFIEHGLDFHMRTRFNDCNIYHCLAKNVFSGAEIAQILFDSGFSAINEMNADRDLPLNSAIIKKNIDLVKFFINNGADFNMRDDFVCYFPMTDAILKADEIIVDLFLSLGVDIDGQDAVGSTVLHYACEYGEKKALELLLKKGADLNVEDRDNETPIYLVSSDDSNVSVNECLVVMIKALANSAVISKTNLDYFKSRPKVREFYQKCSEELTRMKSKIFYAPYSYHSVLEMSKNLKKLAYLTRNKYFVAAFKRNWVKFPCYKEDLKKIFNDAVRVSDELIMIKSHLYSVFKDFFPDVVLDNLSKNLSVKDVKFE